MKAEIKVGSFGNSHSIGIKADHFLFFGSQNPIDLETGRLVRTFRDLPQEAYRRLATGMSMTDVTEERILMQAWKILRNLKDMLVQQCWSVLKQDLRPR
jgi:hypothetical protein